MTGRIKHAQRSKRSSHKQPDFTAFNRAGYARALSRPSATPAGGLLSRLLAPFMGRKHDA